MERNQLNAIKMFWMRAGKKKRKENKQCKELNSLIPYPFKSSNAKAAFMMWLVWVIFSLFEHTSQHHKYQFRFLSLYFVSKYCLHRESAPFGIFYLTPSENMSKQKINLRRISSRIISPKIVNIWKEKNILPFNVQPTSHIHSRICLIWTLWICRQKHI